MILLAFALFGLLALTALFLLIQHLERRGRAVDVVLFLWALLLVDAVLYPGFSSPPGLLHPTVGGLSFRLPEVIIPVALLARLTAVGLPRRVSTRLLWWLAFAAWYLFEAGMGLLDGHLGEDVLFEAKALIYVSGGLLLAAGVPASDYVASRGLPRLIKGASVLALVVLVMSQLGLTVVAELPLFTLERFGEMGADAGTIFATLGIMAVALAARTTQRHGLLLAAGPLLLCPLATRQRAALLALIAALLVMAVGWWVSRGRQRFTITPTEAGLLAMGVLAVLLVPTLGRVPVEEAPTVNPFAEELRSSFTSRSKALSAEARRNQWRNASALVDRRPFLGWGLGKKYWYFEKGPDEFWNSNITHNVGLDLLLRSGVIGLGLFVVAVGASLADGPPTWRTHTDPRLAGLALACTAGVLGLLTRGMVESILEEYRLATALGLLLGTLRACASSVGVSRAEPLGQPSSVQLQR